MKIPTLKNASAMMVEAEQRNPGAWVSHSLYAAQAAQAIAIGYPGLDAQTAFILGYLHDIGRREGITQNRHNLDGFNFLKHQGFDDAARVCLTHSFPVKNVQAVVGQWDNCTTEDINFIQGYLDRIEYNAYDKLIQLCDCLALPSGYCLIEKRFVDVALRYGTNEYTLVRWNAYLSIQNEFEKILNKSIYDYLPGVVENTFKANLLSSGS